MLCRILNLILLVFCIFQSSIIFADKVIIGTTTDNPPFASLADNKGHFYGFEIDLMNEICKRIQAECGFKPIVIKDALTNLNSGKIDLILAAIILRRQNDPALQAYVFSAPYLPSSGQFLVRLDSSYTRMEDLFNKKIGVRFGALFGGTFFRDMVLNFFNQQVEVIRYVSMNDMLAALEDSKIDAIFSNTELVKYWNINFKGAYKLLGSPISFGSGYSIVGMASKPDLMNRIDAALAQIKADGTYVQLYNRYFTL